MKTLGIRGVASSVRQKIYSANYAAQPVIKDVKIIQLTTFASEEGDFGELLRIERGQLKSISGFKLAQINRTKLIPGSIKAWHLHFGQDEIWYVSPSDHLFVGLWDVREKSPTQGKTMRIVIGGGTSQLVFIPHGVAHGSVVLENKPVELYVFVNKLFNAVKHDEKRIPWDSLGADFWLPKRD